MTITREEAIAIIRKEYLCVDRDCDIDRSCGKCDLMMPNKEPILEAYKMAMDALSQEPCDDAVSRQAVIKLFNGNIGSESALILHMVKQLPSVTQKSGKWIEREGWDGDVYYECSVCGEPFCLIDGTPTDNMYNYCPNCGAKMESEEEE